MKERFWIFRTAGMPEKARESVEMVDYVRAKADKEEKVLKRQFDGRFTRMDPREREERLRYLVATPSHADRPLYVDELPTGKGGRKQLWIRLNNDRTRQYLLATRGRSTRR